MKMFKKLILSILITGFTGSAIFGMNPARKQELKIAIREAAANGNAILVKQLIALGAPANEPNCLGWTPLHSAALGGHYEVIKILLESGSITQQIKNSEGYTPTDLAKTAEIRQLIENLPVIEYHESSEPTSIFFWYLDDEPLDGILSEPGY